MREEFFGRHGVSLLKASLAHAALRARPSRPQTTLAFHLDTAIATFFVCRRCLSSSCTPGKTNQLLKPVLPPGKISGERKKAAADPAVEELTEEEKAHLAVRRKTNVVECSSMATKRMSTHALRIA